MNKKTGSRYDDDDDEGENGSNENEESITDPNDPCFGKKVIEKSTCTAPPCDDQGFFDKPGIYVYYTGLLSEINTDHNLIL